MAGWRPEHRARFASLLRAGVLFGLVAATLYAASTLAIKSAWMAGGIMVLWPGDALILAMMLAPGARRPWVIYVAGLTGALAAFCHEDKQMVMAFSRVGLMAFAMPLVYILARRVIGARRIAEAPVLLRFLLICALISAPTAYLRSLILHVVWHFPTIPLTISTLGATLAGYGVITPLILMLARREKRKAIPWRAQLGHWGLLGAYVAGASVALMESDLPLLFIVALALVLISHLVEFAEVAFLILATCLIAVVSSLHGLGPLAHIPGDMRAKIFMVQGFMIVITAAVLPISAIMRDQALLKIALQAAVAEARAGSEAKSTFLATISHEIRTPLNGVLGMAQAILMDELSPAQRKRVEVVRGSGETLLSLLNDVLDLSKIEAGKLTLESIEFDLQKLVDSVVRHAEASATNRGLTLTGDAGAADGVYLGDPKRIRQILNNLVSNAIKFTETGGVSVTATYEAGQGIRIAVRDTGIGIPADKIGALFEKFRQVDETTTRRFGGTGLGLSICRELSEAMGGDVTIDSVEGEGTTFTARLPLERLRDADEPEAVSDEPDARPSFNLRVLAADDNTTNQLVIKTLLNAAGVEPTVVSNGLEAFEAWRDGEWDLILMDAQMPVMDGPTAVGHIRAREAEEGRPRALIYALTANAMEHQVKSYLDVGMDGHIAKPIQVGRLFGLLAQVQEGVDRANAESQAA
jgi:signal transduction histidine kinase/CheY-like chemotaxis protein